MSDITNCPNCGSDKLVLKFRTPNSPRTCHDCGWDEDYPDGDEQSISAEDENKLLKAENAVLRARISSYKAALSALNKELNGD
jgi:hypothetical protein